MIKGKPDLDQQGIDEWRRSNPDADSDKADEPPGYDSILTRHRTGKAEPNMARVRISKTIRMSPHYSEILRDQAFVDSAKQGRKVSESDLANEALREYFIKRGLLPPEGQED